MYSCGLNEVMPPLSAAILAMLELQHKLESKTANKHITIDIACVFSSVLWQQSAGHCSRAIQWTWDWLSWEWKHSPTICHRVIQTALELQKTCNTWMTNN